MCVPFWFTSCESDQIRRYFTWYLCIATSQLWKFYWSFRLRWNFTNDFFIDQVNMITGLFFICIVIIVKKQRKTWCLCLKISTEYRANRSNEDASVTTLHTTISHLEQQGRHARLLFVDFSAALNTILPDRLISAGYQISFYHLLLDLRPCTES